MAAYPVQGMPVMSDSAMLTFLSFQLDDKINVVNWQADRLNTKDAIAEEWLVEDFGPSLIIGGEEYLTFYTEIGALLIKEQYLAPVFTDSSDGQVTFYLRFEGKTPVIAVKKGLYLLAVILPLKTWEIGGTLDRDYEKLCLELRQTMRKMREYEESTDNV